MEKQTSLGEFSCYFSNIRDFGDFSTNLTNTLKQCKVKIFGVDRLLTRIKYDFYSFFEELTTKEIEIIDPLKDDEYKDFLGKKPILEPIYEIGLDLMYDTEDVDKLLEEELGKSKKRKVSINKLKK